MKIWYYHLLTWLCLSIPGALFACLNSSLTLDNVTDNGSSFDITATLCVGGGVGGASNNTKNFFFSFFKSSGITVSGYPVAITSGTGVTYYAFDQGAGAYPAGDGTILYIDCFPECQNFECITSVPACGNAHQTCRQLVFTTDVMPDSIRVFGVEGNGDPFAGCYPQAAMAVYFAPPPSAPLPVELLYFKGLPLENSVDLAWGTAQEIHTGQFLIQRSKDGFSFETIGEVQACGFCMGIREYFFTDENPLPGGNYYRLIIRDLDGSQTYAPVVFINMAEKARVKVFPNPLGGGDEFLQLHYSGERQTDDVLNVAIYNSLGGQVLFQKIKTDGQAGIAKLKINRANIPPGIYQLTGHWGGTVFKERLVFR